MTEEENEIEKEVKMMKCKIHVLLTEELGNDLIQCVNCRGMLFKRRIRGS